MDWLKGITQSVIGAFIFTVLIAVLVLVWALIQAIPGPYIALIVVWAMAGAIWFAVGLRNLIAIRAKTPVRHVTFDPDRYVTAKIMRADFIGLWAAQHDYYVDFVVYVKQTSDWEVTLTDVQGRIRIGTDECSLPARLVNSPRKLTDSRSFYDCIVRQALSQEMASALAVNPGPLNLWDADARVQISLAGLKWIGTVALPQGVTALPDRVVCEEEFTILGPVREGDADKVLIRGGMFLSSQVWRHHDSGALRE